MDIHSSKGILITGGTGSFGKRFLKEIVTKYPSVQNCNYSRDEYKQGMMNDFLNQNTPDKVF